MALSAKGNRLGKAAVTELAEQRAALIEASIPPLSKIEKLESSIRVLTQLVANENRLAAYYKNNDSMIFNGHKTSLEKYRSDLRRVRRKYRRLLQKIEKERTTPPQTDGLPAVEASRFLSDWMTKNWQYIKEIPL